MKILVTGGAGYIGSHTCIELLQAGFEVVVIDNLSNSSLESLRRVELITGQSVKFYQADIQDGDAVNGVFAAHQIDAVIHFAGLKAVGESVEQPIRYFQNNVSGTLTLCEAMVRHDVYNIVFSSSATVYGDPEVLPLTEDCQLSATNPYGRSKLIVEQMLRDLPIANSRWNTILLRYFNPVGAHASGLIGEDPDGIPNNLTPYITQVAVGKLKQLQVFGADYDTPDGTGVRDYIHVVDLAKGHVKAVEKLSDNPGAVAYNLGTGAGYSVLEMIKAFEAASGKKIPFKVAPRRAGDIASCYADAGLAKRELKWQAELGVEEMARDAWLWQSKNPNGFSD
ncbi:UDP-glucose 4-epimerase [Sinobacterium caligoides]|uniref:UDP-glucose 4-epimerase n=1 Tax=Sinobacterium caligoides TaxID=933926 RepID=A0A3N2DK67_9GAMM|nr:UDP-glucose 4-epimerase GalE [Sinobacterium caligoides]ROS00079.1 UDP-glucose 4-epimerase [Sinobacterium caligoides]